MAEKEQQQEAREQEEQTQNQKGQGQEQTQPRGRAKKFPYKHGLIQVFTILGATVASAALAFGPAIFQAFFPDFFEILFPDFNALPVCDMILFVETIWAFAIAVICSHAYNYVLGSEKNPLRDMAAQKQAIWLHSNFAWSTISIWMTVTSLYCTGATIYISGSSLGEGWASDHIIIYSVLSSVLSMGLYVLRPSNRATGFREAYLAVTRALIEDDDDSSQEKLKKAIIEGEEIIAKQDIFSPG